MALAQVMTRMKLNWCGQQKGPEAASKTFLYIIIIFLGYFGVDQLLDALSMRYAPEPVGGNDDAVEVEYSTQWWILYSVRVSLRMIFFLYFLILTIRTRKMVREKYAIPEQNCGGCEDCW